MVIHDLIKAEVAVHLVDVTKEAHIFLCTPREYVRYAISTGRGENYECRS